MSTAVAGVQLGVAQAGIKKVDRDDLVVIALAPGTCTAALFTRNAFRAAPVQIAEGNLATVEAQPRYLMINTGMPTPAPARRVFSQRASVATRWRG